MTKLYALAITPDVLEALSTSLIVRSDGAIVTIHPEPRPMYVGVERLEIPGIETWISLPMMLHVERPRRRALIRRLLSPWRKP